MVCAGAGVALATIADIAIQWMETHKKGECFGLNKIDGERLLRSMIAGGTVGAGCGYFIHQYKLKEEAKKKFCPSKYLRQVLNDHGLKNNPDFLKAMLHKRDKVKECLTEALGAYLAANIYSGGSYGGRTANVGSDLDLCVPIRANSIGTMEDTYQAVYQSLAYLEGDQHLVLIRRQRKSIGLDFRVDDLDIHIDVVPLCISESYPNGHHTHLYVTPKWHEKKGTYIKTDPFLHKKNMAGRRQERQIIRLLKIWRQTNGLKMNSTIIQNMVIKCFDQYWHKIPDTLYERLLFAMEYVAFNLPRCRLVDIANSNNIISERMSLEQKENVSRHLKSDCQRLLKNERYLVELFPLK